MLHVYAATYAAAWAVVAVIAYLISRRWSSDGHRPNHRLLTSTLAGAVWPIILVGLLEAGTVTLLSNSHALREPAPIAAGASNVAELP
ncbi:hypothetical protein [Mycolicibacterium sp. CBMA 234]|uniref:hypothetical protein n=1 Tax=Mycolicibacterium sp. CBMA 234 TaxID=1918495 RepID=UPI0012DFB5C4|nr:hypothetical protein [Mycolicibacterium sp. CBMA 234]